MVGVQVERLDDWTEVVNGREFDLAAEEEVAGKRATRNTQPLDPKSFEASITWYWL